MGRLTPPAQPPAREIEVYTAITAVSAYGALQDTHQVLPESGHGALKGRCYRCEERASEPAPATVRKILPKILPASSHRLYPQARTTAVTSSRIGQHLLSCNVFQGAETSKLCI